MSDYGYQSGIGFGTGSVNLRDVEHKCKFCGREIRFFKGKPQNLDYTQHRCLTRGNSQTNAHLSAESNADLRGYETAAMQAVVTGLVMKGGKDAVHAMDCRLLADAAWGIAVAMNEASATLPPEEDVQE